MYERKALVNDECCSKMPRVPPTANARTPKARKLASGNPAAVPPPYGGGQALITVFVKI